MQTEQAVHDATILLERGTDEGVRCCMPRSALHSKWTRPGASDQHKAHAHQHSAHNAENFVTRCLVVFSKRKQEKNYADAEVSIGRRQCLRS
jgi:hypothetical protein